MRPPLIVIAGQPTSIPLQCYVKGTGGTVKAIFNATDTLSSAIIQHGTTTPVCAPSVDFYTADSTQNGYGQGMVEPSLTTAEALLLVPTVSYTLLVWRALAGSPDELDPIARRQLVILPLAV